MHRRFNRLVRPLKSVPLPVRVALAALLLVGGLLGALPILGFWMIPLALLILSLDFRWARRGYLAILLWFRRRRHARRRRAESGSTSSCRSAAKTVSTKSPTRHAGR